MGIILGILSLIAGFVAIVLMCGLYFIAFMVFVGIAILIFLSMQPYPYNIIFCAIYLITILALVLCRKT
ncbi:hypothetical protein RMP56_000463 [Campylobacter jejuni]|uniref:Uncharacterized protein n=4 Tax=Pseudomonadati TaxID=3379134 RepID=A0A643CXR7_PSEVA|nr:hypothetical protein [Campylobacter jejuni]KAB0483463.1 hypothetical protein F7R09_30215 [Pseudomonas vancouverensis]ASE86255.1 hypothetical protein A6J90_03735 [Campylobacter jejuni]AZU50301.1 hypothetical protein B1780_00790 [Campylobacter jejuni subsp. jejuni]EAH4522698.1 hypothetical protein [Campylobacter jejuni]EAH4564511.1 hypothetical protein [Campylobacter jejuni]